MSLKLYCYSNQAKQNQTYFHSDVMLLYKLWHFFLDPESSKEATLFLYKGSSPRFAF